MRTLFALVLLALPLPGAIAWAEAPVTASAASVAERERLVPLQQGSNFRDIGGYQGAGGKHVRWGMIYRSGATPLLSDADLVTVRGLHLARMIDLRSQEERVLAPTRIEGVPYEAIGYSMAAMMPLNLSAMGANSMNTLYRKMPEFFAPHVKLVFAQLLQNPGPIVYNCSAGQDRTGFMTAMILSALGVPRDTIIADYHLSTTYRRPEFEMPQINPAAFPDNAFAQLYSLGQRSGAARKPNVLKTADGKAYLADTFEAIDAKWGSVDNYLAQEIGIRRADLARLRKTYLQ